MRRESPPVLLDGLLYFHQVALGWCKVGSEDFFARCNPLRP